MKEISDIININIWRGTPGDEADVPAKKLPRVHVPDFDTLVPARGLSLPIQLCRHISKGIIFCIREWQLLSGIESVKTRYVSCSFVAGTSAPSPGAPRHIATCSCMHTYRSRDPKFLEPVERWLRILFAEIKQFLYANGGPIIMIQVKVIWGEGQT